MLPGRSTLRATAVSSAVAAAFVFAGSGLAAAQPRMQAPARAMTLDEALAYAREHQPSLRSALARVTAAAAEARVPRAQWLPSGALALEAFEGTTNNSTASYLGVRGVDLPRIGGTRVSSSPGWSPDTSTLAAVGVQQEVFDFGRIAAQAAVADAATDVERHRASAERLRVELLVKDAFYGVLGARAILRAAEDAHQRASVHRDLAAASVKSGLHAPIELTRAEADLARFDVGRIRADGGLRGAQVLFAAAVGVDDRALDAAGEAPEPSEPPGFEQGLAAARARSPDVEEARARIRAADAATRAVGFERAPDLALTAAFSGRNGTAAPSSGSLADQYGPLPIVPNWDVGLVLRWPFLDPLVGPRRSAAAARGDVARQGLADVEKGQTAAVEQAYLALQVSRAALLGLDRARSAALANYAQAEARFKAGLGTSLELADAENVRTDAEIQLAVGQFQSRRARAALARLIAEGL
jgi:outer membrane protein